MSGARRARSSLAVNFSVLFSSIVEKIGRCSGKGAHAQSWAGMYCQREVLKDKIVLVVQGTA